MQSLETKIKLKSQKYKIISYLSILQQIVVV